MNKKTLFSILFFAFLTLPFTAIYAGCGDAITNPKLNTLLDNIKNLATALGAVIAVISFVVAGILYLTSAGAPDKIGTAKRALIAAVGGAVLIALAQSVNIMTDIICDIVPE